MDPLACGDDSLNNNHANTHLPEVVGVARGWEVTQNATLANIAANFHSILSEHYSYATGGSNVNEHWSSPDQLGDAVATSFNADEEPQNSNGFHVRQERLAFSCSPAPSLTSCLLRGCSPAPSLTGCPPASRQTEETCTQYNTLKVLRHLFRWKP